MLLKSYTNLNGAKERAKPYEKAPAKRSENIKIDWKRFDKFFPRFVGQGLKEVARAVEGAARKSVKQKTLKSGKVPVSTSAGAPYYSRRKGGIAKKFINIPVSWCSVMVTYRGGGSKFSEENWQTKVQTSGELNKSFVNRIAKKAANRYIIKHSVKGKKKR